MGTIVPQHHLVGHVLETVFPASFLLPILHINAAPQDPVHTCRLVACKVPQSSVEITYKGQWFGAIAKYHVYPGFHFGARSGRLRGQVCIDNYQVPQLDFYCKSEPGSGFTVTSFLTLRCIATATFPHAMRLDRLVSWMKTNTMSVKRDICWVSQGLCLCND